MAEWSTASLEKLTVGQQLEGCGIPFISWNSSAQYNVNKSPPVDLIWSKMNLVHTAPLYYLTLAVMLSLHVVTALSISGFQLSVDRDVPYFKPVLPGPSFRTGHQLPEANAAIAVVMSPPLSLCDYRLLSVFHYALHNIPCYSRCINRKAESELNSVKSSCYYSSK